MKPLCNVETDFTRITRSKILNNSEKWKIVSDHYRENFVGIKKLNILDGKSQKKKKIVELN